MESKKEPPGETQQKKTKIKRNNIRFYLKKMEMTQTDLARKCKMAKGYISRLANNKVTAVSLPVAIRICKVLKQPVEKVFILQ